MADQKRENGPDYSPEGSSKWLKDGMHCWPARRGQPSLQGSPVADLNWGGLWHWASAGNRLHTAPRNQHCSKAAGTAAASFCMLLFFGMGEQFSDLYLRRHIIEKKTT